jgi:hypothetical protein
MRGKYRPSQVKKDWENLFLTDLLDKILKEVLKLKVNENRW